MAHSLSSAKNVRLISATGEGERFKPFQFLIFSKCYFTVSMVGKPVMQFSG